MRDLPLPPGTEFPSNAGNGLDHLLKAPRQELPHHPHTAAAALHLMEAVGVIIPLESRISAELVILRYLEHHVSR